MKQRNAFTAILLCIAVITISSCTKKQTALNNLLGTWTYQSVVPGGTTVSISAAQAGLQTLTFQACAATNTFCQGTIVTNSGSSAFSYSLNNEGTVVSVNNSDNTSDTYNINTLDAHHLVYTQVSSGNKFTLTK